MMRRPSAVIVILGLLPASIHAARTSFSIVDTSEGCGTDNGPGWRAVKKNETTNLDNPFGSRSKTKTNQQPGTL